MTTHVPDGTSGQAVDDVRGREAPRSRELAGHGHLLRLWVLQAIIESLPLYGWMTAVTTPLTGT
jgi:muconolactone delta-isomerase